MLVFGVPLDPAELVRHIDAVDEDAVIRVARRFTSGAPTVAALGPIGRIEDYQRLAEQLRR
jgi:hypothetical protein